jgi:hypothetical protein
LGLPTVRGQPAAWRLLAGRRHGARKSKFADLLEGRNDLWIEAQFAATTVLAELVGPPEIGMSSKCS